MSDLATILPERNFLELRAEIRAGILARYPDWQDNEGELDVLISEGLARIGAMLFQQLGSVGTEVLRNWGLKIIDIPPIFAAPSSVASTWTMKDAVGYPIPAGTQVRIARGDGKTFGFRVVKDVLVPPGETGSSAGEVLLQATQPGTEFDGLSGPVSLEDRLTYVDTIELTGITAGGADEEDPDAYLARLIPKLRTLSFSLILTRDFEIDALDTAGIGRALAIRGYDVEAEEENVACAIALAVATTAGSAAPALTKEALEASQRGRLLSGVKYGLLDPTLTPVDVKASVTPLPGFEPAGVTAAAADVLARYLDPSLFARPTRPAAAFGNWVKVDGVYRNDLIAAVDQAPGVDRVVQLDLAISGDPLKPQESVALDGVAPLAEAGAIEVTAA
jgi:hypothetical protein